MLLHSILVISIIFFTVLLIVCYNRLQTKKEEYKNYFHITKTDKDQEYSYKPDQIILSNRLGSDFSDKDKYFGDFDHQGKLNLNEMSKLYIGNSVRGDTQIDAEFLNAIDNTNFPYIEQTSEGDRLRFNKENNNYIDANNLRALKGQKLVPFYNDSSENAHALKIVADTASFEDPGFRCGYLARAQYKRGKITGIIPYGNEY